jgi:hypothetical protein
MKEELPTPPLGLRPKFIVQEHRLMEIVAAIDRYKNASVIGSCPVPIPQEWLDEKEEIEAELSLKRKSNDEILLSSDPIHCWFGLSYAQYLTIPRTVLQSMPIEWQRVFVKCLNQIDEVIDWMPKEGTYRVQLMKMKEVYSDFGSTEEWDHELHDELADYQRGRRKLTLKKQ